jgi:hypothetical protein
VKFQGNFLRINWTILQLVALSSVQMQTTELIVTITTYCMPTAKLRSKPGKPIKDDV